MIARSIDWVSVVLIAAMLTTVVVMVWAI